MTQQTINIGTSPNAGNGDTIRVAAQKLNENFDEVYKGPRVLSQAEIDLLTPRGGLMVYNSSTGKFQGYAEAGAPGWIDLH